MKINIALPRLKLLIGSSLGLFLALFIPFSAEALTSPTTISSVIGSTINVFTTSGTVNLNATPTGSGVQTTASDTITVSTNNSAGFTLSVAETTSSANLVSGANSILPTTGTYASPAALVANRWGFALIALAHLEPVLLAL